MAKNDKVESVPVTGSIPVGLRDAIEEYRWANRKTVSEVVREAIEAYARDKGIKPAPTAPESDEAEKPARRR